MDPSILVIAYFGGLMSFLTPCNLINTLSFVSFTSAEGTSMKRGFFLSVIFGLGFSLTFSAIGIALLFIPGFILRQVGLQIVGGIVIIFMGAIMIFQVFKKKSNEEMNEQEIEDNIIDEDIESSSESALPTYSKSFVLGVSLSTMGISCTLPVLTGVLITIASSSDQFGGFLALFFYGFGLICPFIILGLVLGKVNEFLILKLVRITPKLQIIFSFVLIFLGSYITYNALTILGVF